MSDVIDVEGHEGLVDAAGALLTDPSAERLLLGGLMMKPAEMMQVSEYIGGPDFSDPYHRRLFEVMRGRFESDEPLTIAALIDALGGDPKAMLAGVGLTAGQYVARLKADSDLSADLVEIAERLQAISEHRAHSIIADSEFEANEPFQSRFGLKMWVDQNDPAEQYEFLVEDLIPENEGVLVMGASGTGKSFLTTHLAMCGARGVPFFGCRILRPFGTIWCAYEAARGSTARMRAYRKHHGLDLDDLPFGVLTKPLALWPDPKAVDELVKEMRAIEQRKFMGVPLKMIVFDTYNAATPGASEIDSEVVSKIRAQFERFRSATGASTVIVGHTNAVGKHRGNEQLTNNIDTVIVVARKTKPISPREVIELKDDDGRAIRTMKVTKQREGIDGEENDFVLHIVEDGTKNKFGKPRTSCVVAAPNVREAPVDDDAGKGDRHVGAKVTRQDAQFLECLLEMLDEVGVSPPAELQLHRSISKVVNYDHVKRLMSKKMLRDEDNTEEGLKKHRATVKQAVIRARSRLQHVKVVDGDGPTNLIWWTGKPVKGIPATQPRDRSLFDNDPPPLSDDDIAGLY